MEIFSSIHCNLCKFYVMCLGCRAVGSACILNAHKLTGRATLPPGRFSNLYAALKNLTAVSIQQI